jgi:hypothetical protein
MRVFMYIMTSLWRFETIIRYLTKINFFIKNRPTLSAFLTTEMPDRPASSQSGTGLEKANDAGSGPVPE